MAPSNNIWIDTFHDLQRTELGERYGHIWTLQFNYKIKDTLPPDMKQKGWKISQASHRASFTCEQCSHFWNSARVALIFHYCLRRPKKGIVFLRPFEQSCRECDNDFYVKPRFKEDNVETILNRLILKIRKNCYKEDIDSDVPGPNQPVFRTKPHEKELCEACMEGICNRDRDVS